MPSPDKVEKSRLWLSDGEETNPEIVGNSRGMQRVKSLIRVVGSSNCTVLITGETGTGKELIARSIHAGGARARGPFITVDCTTLRDTLFESQLFGHQKGAFTGAEHDTLGFFRAADHGTLFLDEIGELDPAIQAKLLRCIQDAAVIPLGGIKPIRVDVRLIAATHRHLKEMVRDGRFREDLYFRLNVVTLASPPLRERMEDIPALAEHLLVRLATLYARPEKMLTADALSALGSHSWPGNVRELANALEHAFVLSPGTRINVADLPEEVGLAAKTYVAGRDVARLMSLAQGERALIFRTLLHTAGNQAQAARILQINRKRLYRKIRLYKIKIPAKSR